MPKYKVKVTAMPEKGFRRAGFQFTREASEVTVDEKQLKILQEEPLLAVQVLEELSEGGQPTGKTPTAAELIERIKTAATEAEVDAIRGGDQRKTVIDAADARKAELSRPE